MALRVKNGGHNIPEDIVRRRYKNGLENLMKIYMPICDSWFIYDNSSSKNTVTVVAFGQNRFVKKIENQDIYAKIKCYDD